MNYRQFYLSNLIIFLITSLLFLSCEDKKKPTVGSLDLTVILEQEYYELFTVADKLRKEGKFEESITLFEKSLSASKKITDKKKECESLLKLGLLYWNIGQLKDSSVHYENALQLAQKFNIYN